MSCLGIRLFEAVLVPVSIGGALLGGSKILGPVMTLTLAVFAVYGSGRPIVEVCPYRGGLLVRTTVFALVGSLEEGRPLEHMRPLSKGPRVRFLHYPKDLLACVSGQVSKDVKTRDDY